jgi:hypothetical protein
MDQHRLDRMLTLLHSVDDDASVLHRICVVCVDVTSMAGAGVSRIIDGRHDTLEASHRWAASVESLQVTLTDGPCLEVVTSFKPSVEPDLTSPGARRRWPRFAPAAVEQGVAAAFAFPLLTGSVAIGALDVYAARPGDMQLEQVQDALILAGLAGLAVERFDQPSTVTGVDLIAEPAEDWAYASIVHNASGMVSERLGVDLDEALLRLRAIAFATERRVDDLARDIVERTMRVDSWTEHG